MVTDAEAVKHGDIVVLEHPISLYGLGKDKQFVNRMSRAFFEKATAVAKTKKKEQASQESSVYVNIQIEIENIVWVLGKRSRGRGTLRISGRACFVENDAGGWTALLKTDL